MSYHLAFTIPNHLTQRAKPGTLLLETADCVDDLSSQVWKYFGERVITKKKLRATRDEILAWANKEYGTDFKRLVIA